MNRDALIVVDMLNDFLDPDGALYCGPEARAVIPFVRRRIEAYRAANHLVVFLQDAHDSEDREFEKFPKHCIAGTWGSRIIPELTPGPEDRVVPKRRYSGFFGTDLEAILQSARVQLAEVVGVCTSICVMDTVGGLANRDYRIRVPVAGVADIDPESHGFALQRMRRLYGADVS